MDGAVISSRKEVRQKTGDFTGNGNGNYQMAAFFLVRTSLLRSKIALNHTQSETCLGFTKNKKKQKITFWKKQNPGQRLARQGTTNQGRSTFRWQCSTSLILLH